MLSETKEMTLTHLHSHFFHEGRSSGDTLWCDAFWNVIIPLEGFVLFFAITYFVSPN